MEWLLNTWDEVGGTLSRLLEPVMRPVFGTNTLLRHMLDGLSIPYASQKAIILSLWALAVFVVLFLSRGTLRLVLGLLVLIVVLKAANVLPG